MIASSLRAALQRILTHFPDGATVRITYPAVYCHLAAPRSVACCGREQNPRQEKDQRRPRAGQLQWLVRSHFQAGVFSIRSRAP